MKPIVLLTALMMSSVAAWAQEQVPEKIEDIGIDTLLPEISVVEQQAPEEPVKQMVEKATPEVKTEMLPAVKVVSSKPVTQVRKVRRARSTTVLMTKSNRRPASNLPWPGAVKSVVREYVVKSGDTLSAILHALDIKPLYGGRGWVKHNMALNSDIANWQRLKPGQKLRLEVPETIAATTSPAQVSSPPRLTAVKPNIAPQPSATRWSASAESARTEAYVSIAPRRDVRSALRQRPAALRPLGGRLPSS